MFPVHAFNSRICILTQTSRNLILKALCVLIMCDFRYRLCIDNEHRIEMLMLFAVNVVVY